MVLPLLLAALVPAAPGGAFTANEPVAFTCAGERPSVWRLQDWQGADAGKGVFGEKLEMANPGTGYWKLVTDAGELTFAVVCDPSARTADCEFFAVDSAQSWCASRKMFDCPWFDGDSYRAVTEMIRRAGVRHVRDRMGWGHVKKTADGPVKGDRYGKNADLLAAAGIRISSVFHDAPAYADVSGLLPRDLVATRDFCRDVARFFGDKMEMWEFWNEPDIFFAEAPVWDYAAAFKAAALGFREGNPKAVVANAAFANAILSSYGDGLAANGIWTYSDVLNWHTYADLREYERLYRDKASYLKKHGLPSLASVLTECGTNQEGNSEGDGVQKGKKAHSPEQELVHAEFLPKSMIGHQMLGSWRDYFFMFGVLNERDGKKDWGILRRNGTVKPAYAALATLTEFAGSKRLLGETRLGDGVRAFLYEGKDGRQTLAAWSMSELDTDKGVVSATNRWARRVTVPVRARTVLRAADMCGRAVKVERTDGAVTLDLTRWPTYLEGDLGLKADVPAVAAGPVVRRKPAADEDLSLIVRVDLEPSDWKIDSGKTKAILTNGLGRLAFRIWNLSSQPRRVILASQGVSLAGVGSSVDVPANGSAAVAATCGEADWGPDAAIQVAAVAGGRRSTPLVVPVAFEKRLTPSPKAVRFGVISDTHVSHDDPQTAREELGKALRHFREQKVDAVIHCGDMTNFGYLDELDLFAEIWTASMPTSIPLVAVLGNRDMSDTKKLPDDVRKRDAAKLICSQTSLTMESRLGIRHGDGIRVTDIRGVKVVAADWGHTDCLEKFLDAHPECRDPRNFLIHVQHIPPGAPVVSGGKGAADPVTCALNMYPNVLSLSGHSHATFTTGGQYRRGFFTVAGAGCHYLAKGPDHARREVMVLTLDGDEAELVRRDLKTGYEDIRRWTRDTSFDKKPLAKAKDAFRFVQWNAYGFKRGTSEARRSALAALDGDWIGISEFAPEADKGRISQTVFDACPSVEFGPKKGPNCNALVSRLKPTGEARPRMYGKSRAERYWLQADYDVDGRRVTVFQTHLDLTKERKAEIAELVKAASDCPYAIVAGDFNVEDLSEYAPFAAAGFVAANGGAFGTHLTHRKRKTTFSPAVDNVFVKGFEMTGAFTFDDDCRLSDHRMLVCDFKWKGDDR